MADCPNINTEDSSNLISKTNIRISNMYETLASINEVEQSSLNNSIVLHQTNNVIVSDSAGYTDTNVIKSSNGGIDNKTRSNKPNGSIKAIGPKSTKNLVKSVWTSSRDLLRP